MARSKKTSQTPESNRFSKHWDPDFSTDRKPLETRSYVRLLEECKADGRDLELFFEAYEDVVPNWGKKAVRRYCQHASLLSDTIQDAMMERRSPRIWLDDREKTTQFRRSYKARLSTLEFYQFLCQQRYDFDEQPNADRRLIYIPDLDPDSIVALIRTAPNHQVPTLQEAIVNYLALHTSLRVKIPSVGYKIFRLEFNLSYLALRETHSPLRGKGEKPTQTKPNRERIPLDFLQIDPSEEQEGCHFYLYDAQITLAICGSDESHWTAYAFVDTDHDSNQNEDDDEDDDSPIAEDPIASDFEGSLVVADDPIWDPRAYFLRILEIRMERMVVEWKNLVQTYEQSVKAYRAKSRVMLLHQHGERKFQLVQETTEWTARAMDVLSILQERSDEYVRTWTRFSDLDGDICYFMEMEDQSAQRALSNISESFETLINLDKRLSSLFKPLEQSRKALELHMGLDANQFNRRTHSLGLQASRLSRESQLLSLESNRLSLENHQTAEKTSRASKISLEITQSLTPVALVIGYFSTEHQIFAFDRNAKTFIICIGVTMLALRVYSKVLDLVFDKGFSELKGRIKWCMGQSDRTTQNRNAEADIVV